MDPPASSSTDSGLGDLDIFPYEVLLLHILPFCDMLTLHRLAFVSTTLREIVTDPAVGLKPLLMANAFKLIDTQRNTAAIRALETIVLLFPRAYEAYKEMGCCYMDRGQHKKALHKFRHAVSVCDSEAYKCMLNAQIQWALGNNVEAWKHSNQAVETDPSDPRFYHFRAYVQSLLSEGPEDTNSQEKELADYAKILNELTYHRRSIIHNNRGYVHYERREFDLAMEDFEQSIELCPWHAQSYYNMAVCQGDQGDFEGALECCNKLLALNSDNPDAYAIRGWVYICTDNMEGAIHDYKIAAMENPRIDPSAITIYLGALVSHSLFDTGKVELEKMIPKLSQEVEKLKKKLEIEQSEENQNFLKTRIKQKTLCWLVSLRIRTELDILTGVFDHVKEWKQQFIELSQNAGDSMTRWNPPFFKHVTELELEKVSPEAIAIVQKYHEFRAKGEAQAAKRFVDYLTEEDSKLEQEVDQLYFFACFAHIYLPLYWDSDPRNVATFQEFWENWKIEDFLGFAVRPALLVYVFELCNRVGNQTLLQFLPDLKHLLLENPAELVAMFRTTLERVAGGRGVFR